MKSKYWIERHGYETPWHIFKSDSNSGRGDKIVAAFTTRKMAREYLKLLKIQEYYNNK